MSDKTIMIIALIVLTIVHIINAIRVEIAIKAVNDRIDEIDMVAGKTAKHINRVVELTTEASSRSIYVEGAVRNMDARLHDLDNKVIDIIKRYINYREPISEVDEVNGEVQ